MKMRWSTSADTGADPVADVANVAKKIRPKKNGCAAAQRADVANADTGISYESL
jgi:hypothetical protein